MKIVGIVGLPASGKGEFSANAGEMGIPVVIMGDRIRRAVEASGLPPTDANLGYMAQKLRDDGGMDAIARLCVPEIRKHKAPLVLIDGIRGDSEVTHFRQAFPSFLLVRIDSLFENRLARIRKRGRSDDLSSEDQLRARDARELIWGLGYALEIADLCISNNGSIEEYSASVRRLLEKLGRDP